MSEQDLETKPTTDLDPRELRELLEEIRRQNVWLKRYLFVYGAALALLLLLQFSVVSKILEYVLVVAIVLAVLLTAPFWSRGVSFITERIPWFSSWRTKNKWSRERDL